MTIVRWRGGAVAVLGLLLASAHHAACQDPGPGPERWILERDLVIGEPEVSLTTVSHLLVASDGSIYVAQPEEHRVRKFAADGAPILEIGRRGRGPGEFQALRFLGWRGDTLTVADRGLLRISAFSSAGDLYHTASSALAPVAHIPRAFLAGGHLLVEQVFDSELIASGQVRERPLLLLDREGAVVRRLGTLTLGAHTVRVVVEEGGEPTYLYLPHPFADSDLYDVDPHGRSVVVISQAGPEAGDPRFSVTRMAPTGRPEWTRSFRHDPQPASAMPRDTLEIIATTLAGSPLYPNVPRARIERSLRRDIAVPTLLAPVTAVVAGRDGTTWIRRELTGTEGTWMVLDGDGEWIGEARAPGNPQLLQADRSHAWGIEHDDWGAPQVVRYRVHPDPSPPHPSTLPHSRSSTRY